MLTKTAARTAAAAKENRVRNRKAGRQASSSDVMKACIASALALAIGGAAWAQQATPGAAASEQVTPAPSSGERPPAGPAANDYPTLARVEYVFECLEENAGPRHEMVYKCVCAVDRVAESVPYDRWIELSTFFKAQPMAGERGAYVRERSDIQSQLKSYRELQARVRKACFIPEKK
jgi:hypothetical protein